MVTAITECLLNQSQLEYNNPTCNEPGSMIFKEKNQTSINQSNDYSTICPECKSNILVHNSANEEYICQTCGCVILEGSFENDDKSDGFSVYDYGLKTKISFVDSIEYKGNVLSTTAADYQKAAEHTFHNQHRGNSKMVFTSTKLSKTQSEINDICSSLYLSNKVRQ